VELWQAVLSFVAALSWWQTVLVFIATICIALLIGTFITYLILRFVRKTQVPFLSLLYLLFGRKPKVFTSRDLARQLIDKPSASHEPAKFPIAELLAECEYNRNTATEFSGDNLLPLQTDVWDAHRYAALTLADNVRVQLEQVYTDIYSLNSIVWLSTELGHRSSFSDELYRKLLIGIAERLDRIKQNIE
jgi:hypothetical protein